MSTIAYIGLGSNLGDSRQILTQAVSRLSTLGPVKVSRLYQSPPMGPQDQPHYYNAVAQLETVLEPLPLLDQLQAFEQEAGRVRLRRWGERTLDLDLLLYGQQSIQHERLNVPHIGLLERDFVVIPLLDLDASLSVNGQLLQQLDLVQQSELTVLADEQWASI
ncbi:2-amino-4-hydroxy-6-hydroxymethyldihydropteridine diphosphokinase [Acinetobacter radioresistens]|jgi:2-amino-4-hydroxy-6-hydroxymethyldihydropteridine diphosphokinase|uniref:2-amino-4-hydroxy-6-hydroxymethyldihydropteridine pyrophosphokinase n=1 Tax=Acinetobacter radioresistens TaxID=40216 RepID=A0A2T1J313_ACIRA|nr:MULTISPECIES: 2-amino-4-hydroxy-6-hydroxymethyldihydropteridine diphosphokinase [Acinetobacter]AWV85505.1 2-amino-4-hydroxy-6-hydroxymethyldihydropteridine diphosphokinase [Acinetobacter radioresistens]EJO36446.1 2-amino-4-hydroxy-6-hydroxymethyldihydropteridine diphosphokinase [Acinetobacter radioresistens WC-A-157]EXE58475.1 2-amino-4-hydroxy-6-hydroxymethyldihydropteridine diphosphokinase [Acinetobacter sp. 1239920]EXF58620.1 2-amino-4-hydroxy-6-hydroxymethyldihydropteridine diphosphokina